MAARGASFACANLAASDAELSSTHPTSDIPGFRELLQIGIPERKSFELRALEDFILNTSATGRTGKPHVRSALEFHLVFIAGGSLLEGLASPNRRLRPMVQNRASRT